MTGIMLTLTMNTMAKDTKVYDGEGIGRNIIYFLAVHEFGVNILGDICEVCLAALIFDRMFLPYP